jgi:RNA polymerase sigma factor (sigma-70 family)
MALVALSLGAIALCVFFPVGATSVIMTSVAAFVWAADRLGRVGALEASAFGGATYLAGALLLVGTGAATLVALVKMLRATGETEGGRRRLPLVWRWPWFLLGAALMLANAMLIPPYRSESTLPGVVGAFILATLGWIALTTTYVLFRVGGSVLGASWRLARGSPYSAGLITAGGMGCAILFLALNGIAETLGSSSSQLPARSARLSCPSATECWREVFVAASKASSSSPLSVGSASSIGALGGGGGGEPPDGNFERCLQAYQAAPTLQLRARQVAASIVGDANAHDVVRDTLLQVCLHPRAIDELEPFLIKSIRYRAISWIRSPVNWGSSCTIEVLPEPACQLRPDDEYLRQEVRATVSRALCALKESDRELLRLKYFEERSDLEIAYHQGISHDAVRKALQRARERLREEFLRKCGGEVLLGNQ